MTASDRDESFFARWSRRKRAEAARDTPVRPASAGEGEGGEETLPPAAERGQALPSPAAEPVVDPAELPDPDTLDATSDFRIFLRKGVPEELQRRALRRLWRVNPIISAVDPLFDYGGDYTDAATVVPDLRTVFKVGRETLERLAGQPGAPSEGASAATGTRQADAGTDGGPTEKESSPADASDAADRRAG